MIPVTGNTFVFTEININVPPNVIVSNAIELYQGNVNGPELLAMTWLKSKRGIRCAQAGGFIAEYNYRFFEEKVNFGNSYMSVLRDLYIDHF